MAASTFDSFEITPENFDIQTVYIPRMSPETSDDYISSQFEYYDLADVKRIDFVFKYNEKGEALFKQAFVHLQWYNNACAQRLRALVELDRSNIKSDVPQARLVHDDPHYWILLNAHNPLPKSTAEYASRLADSGDIGSFLDSILNTLEIDSNVDIGMISQQFNVLGLAFNKLREQKEEMTHKLKINQTLLTAMSHTNEQLRLAHSQMGMDQFSELNHLNHRYQLACKTIHEEQIKSERLISRCSRLQEVLVKSRNETQTTRGQLSACMKKLNRCLRKSDVESWTHLTPREGNPSLEEYLHLTPSEPDSDYKSDDYYFSSEED
jgi:hypothetical protein